MTASDWDVIIGGTKARLKQTADGTPYKRRTIRREIQNSFLAQSENPQLQSRDDRVSLYQSSWAQGARWWKPLIDPQELKSYFRSNHFDTWSEPGKIVPMNAVTDAANTPVVDDCVVISVRNEVYAVGTTNNVNASFRDVYKWTPGSNAFVQETGYHSGVGTADQVVSAVYDDSDGYVYTLCLDASTGGRMVSRFNPSSPAQDANWLLGGTTLSYGATIMVTRGGLIYYEAGPQTGRLYKIDKSGPSITSVFDDGLAEIVPMPTSATDLFRTADMAAATPEGIFYAKNTMIDGQFQTWVWRVDQDSAGNWVGTPYAPLPLGSMTLSLAYHLGSIILASTPEPQSILDQTDHAEIVLYHYTDSQPGALGSILGRGEVDETPYGMLGTRGPYLYIGGHKRLWMYDAVQGALHSVFEWGTEQTNKGPYRTMAWNRDSADAGIVLYFAPDRLAYHKRNVIDNPDTVVAFGDDETFYTLESNYFDAGLPMELKELTKVAILRDPSDGDQEYTIQVSVDDGAFEDVLVHSASGEVYAEATDMSGLTTDQGYQFRYKVIYQTKDTNRNAIRAVLLTYQSGEMLTEWDLLLDGSQLRNVNNEEQDPKTFYDAMVTLGDTSTSTTLLDNFQDLDRLEDVDGTATNVKVVAVEIMKDSPGESEVRIVLREV